VVIIAVKSNMVDLDDGLFQIEPRDVDEDTPRPSTTGVDLSKLTNLRCLDHRRAHSMMQLLQDPLQFGQGAWCVFSM
jgi:hypothetical protein